MIGVLIQIFFLKPILKWIPERKSIVAAISCMAAALGLIGLSVNIFMLFLAVTLLALGNSVSGPVLAGLVSKKTPDNEQGNIMGITQSIGSVARLIGSIVGTFLYSQFNPQAPYLIATIILIFTAFFSIKNLSFVKVKLSTKE